MRDHRAITEYSMSMSRAAHKEIAPILEHGGESAVKAKEPNSSSSEETDWNVAVVMQVHGHHADCLKRRTWTAKLIESDARHLPALRAWGPYRSEYRTLIEGVEDGVFPATP